MRLTRMSHFYITLPSDGSKIFFQAIHLLISRRDWQHQFLYVGEWDVALYEFITRIMACDKPDDAEII